jgi:hypothetical protein
LGSVANAGLLRAIDGLMQAIIPAKLQIEVEPIPLNDVERAWQSKGEGRIVFTI